MLKKWPCWGNNDDSIVVRAGGLGSITQLSRFCSVALDKSLFVSGLGVCFMNVNHSDLCLRSNHGMKVPISWQILGMFERQVLGTFTFMGHLLCARPCR